MRIRIHSPACCFGYLWIISCRSIPAPAVQIKAQLLHLVGVAVLLVAGHAEVKVVADGAVVAGLHRLLAGVAGVHKLVLALRNSWQIFSTETLVRYIIKSVRMKMNNRPFNIQLFLLPPPYKFSFNPNPPDGGA